MLVIIRNFIRKVSPNLSFDSLGKTPEGNPSFTLYKRQEIDPVNALSAFENKPD
jgi:hypothetical protein